MPRPAAVITGPACGIGAGYARRYANDGYDLVPVARDVDRLTELAGELEQKAGAVEVLRADLSDPADSAMVCDRLAGGVRVLVNNAGIGTSGELWNTDPALLQTQLDVNVTAVVHLTRAALPAMLDAGAGTVINVASVAGLLRGRGPSARTEFHARAGIDVAKLPSFRWLEGDDVVSQSLADGARGNVISIPRLQYTLVATERMIPRTLMPAVTKRVGGGRGRP